MFLLICCWFCSLSFPILLDNMPQYMFGWLYSVVSWNVFVLTDNKVFSLPLTHQSQKVYLRHIFVFHAYPCQGHLACLCSHQLNYLDIFRLFIFRVTVLLNGRRTRRWRGGRTVDGYCIRISIFIHDYRIDLYTYDYKWSGCTRSKPVLRLHW